MSHANRPHLSAVATSSALVAQFALPALTEAATIAHWRFEGASAATAGANNDWLDDYSGNGHNLSSYSSVGGTQLPIPSTGPGAAFPDPVPGTNAPNQYAASLTDTTLYAADNDVFTNASFSIEAYFNLKTSPTAFSVIAGNWSSNGNHRGYMLSIDVNREVELHLSSTGASTSNERILSGLTVSVDTDYYVAVTVDMADLTSSGITFYHQQLSGTGAGSLSAGTGKAHANSTVFNGSSPFTIGGQGSLTAHRFAGVIDEVRLSSGKLGRNELLAVPEPASLATLAIVGAGLLGRRRRRH